MKINLKNLAKKIIKIPINFIQFFRIKNLAKLLRSVGGMAAFLGLLLSYLVMIFVVGLTTKRFFPKKLGVIIVKPLMIVYNNIVDLSSRKDDSIRRIDLIELAIRNMKFKKSRTLITIGGMSIGIAAIIFLVSIGYGLEDLVTSKVARLDEMKQTDISTQPGSNMRITDATLASLSEIGGTKHTLPLIALVGRVNYNDSVIDMAVYGVTSEYLKQSAIKPIKGDIFASDNISVPENTTYKYQEQIGDVAGASTKSVEEKELNGEVEFSISENEYVRVRSNPDTGATLIGYATKSNQTQKGLQVWGASYNNTEHGKAATNQSNQPMGKWITSTFEIYEKDGDGYKLKLSDKGEIVKESGYIAMLDNVQMLSFRQLQPQVLGESTEIILESENRPSVLAGTTEDKSLALVTTDDLKSTAQQIEQKTSEVLEGITEVNGEVIFQDSEATSKEKIIKVALSSDAIKEAVVNRAMLKVLNISEEESIGKTFEVAFIVPGTLLDNASDGKVQSESTSYEIVGVVPQDDSPFFYAPFIDLRGIGVTNYSQVKLVSDRQDVLAEIRKKVESMGFLTSSVVDTVQQINSLFATARTVLALIGTVALAVAALGMFNTLTVSLLERIREIGLMKAMGMKSSEVKELFLTESMIMGFFGGILGILMGYLAGKFVSVLLTLIAINSNSGFLDISTVPVSIVIVVMALSVTVGLITGIYPARKATRISALNALRYE